MTFTLEFSALAGEKDANRISIARRIGINRNSGSLLPARDCVLKHEPIFIKNVSLLLFMINPPVELMMNRPIGRLGKTNWSKARHSVRAGKITIYWWCYLDVAMAVSIVSLKIRPRGDSSLLKANIVK